MGARTVEMAGAGRPGARDPGNQADARPAAARRAPVLGLGAAEVLDLSVPVRAVGDLSFRTERSARAAAAARSADARLALPRSAGPRAAHAARRQAAAAHARGCAACAPGAAIGARRHRLCLQGASGSRHRSRVARRDRRARPRPARVDPQAAGVGAVDAGVLRVQLRPRRRGARRAQPARTGPDRRPLHPARLGRRDRNERRLGGAADHRPQDWPQPHDAAHGDRRWRHAAAGDLRARRSRRFWRGPSARAGSSTRPRPAALPSSRFRSPTSTAAPGSKRSRSSTAPSSSDFSRRHPPSAPARGATSARSAAPTSRGTSRARPPSRSATSRRCEACHELGEQGAGQGPWGQH